MWPHGPRYFSETSCCCCSVTQLFLTICDTISQTLLKLMSTESAIPSNHLLLSPSPPTPYLSQHQGLFHESALLFRWPKYCSFSFNISSSNELSGLISFRIDWLDLFAVQGTLRRLLQHHSSKASILWPSAIFAVQLTFIHDYWKKKILSCLVKPEYAENGSHQLNQAFPQCIFLTGDLKGHISMAAAICVFYISTIFFYKLHSRHMKYLALWKKR